MSDKYSDLPPAYAEIKRQDDKIAALTSERDELRAQLGQAEQSCRDRIKADRIYCLKHGDEFVKRMTERLEQAEARVAMLEQALIKLRKPWDLGQILGAETRKRVMQADEALRGRSEAWLLRQKAETIESFVVGSGINLNEPAEWLFSYLEFCVRQLRRAADEAEKGVRDDA